MSSKKSFFEKLRLIEAIEEPEKGETVENDDSFYLNPNDEEIQAEFQEMMKEDSFSPKKEEVEWTEKEPESDPVIPESEQIDYRDEIIEAKVAKEESQPSVIEDKLNTLIEAYEKNKLLSIDEIYRNARLNADSKKSIFIADVFLKTLPENLPVDIKRTSLLNILNVSNINIEELLTDAFQRIDSLNTVLENTVNTTDDIAQKNEATIKDLEKRIEELRNVVEARRKFQEDQNTLIEYEIQRIINIVDFIKPKK